MFDCVLPTRNGRNATAFTRAGALKLRNAKHAEDPRPLEDDCDCGACQPWKHGWAMARGSASGAPGGGAGEESPFSRAYIRHLFMADEMLGPILVSVHNLRYFQRFMADVRATVLTDDWQGLVARWPTSAPALASAATSGPGGNGSATNG
jgi:queuine tRNA-ribosyltransferase